MAFFTYFMLLLLVDFKYNDKYNFIFFLLFLDSKNLLLAYFLSNIIKNITPSNLLIQISAFLKTSNFITMEETFPIIVESNTKTQIEFGTLNSYRPNFIKVISLENENDIQEFIINKGKVFSNIDNKYTQMYTDKDIVYIENTHNDILSINSFVI